MESEEDQVSRKHPKTDQSTSSITVTEPTTESSASPNRQSESSPQGVVSIETVESGTPRGLPVGKPTAVVVPSSPPASPMIQGIEKEEDREGTPFDIRSPEPVSVTVEDVTAMVEEGAEEGGVESDTEEGDPLSTDDVMVSAQGEGEGEEVAMEEAGASDVTESTS
eukprot:GILK01009483.1.p1 GENE.GILK01009483.1~~GILK01009483.1.p1  ORF type:complete len:183 (+),score=64.02 GILK01009483.1:52-549(+)